MVSEGGLVPSSHSVRCGDADALAYAQSVFSSPVKHALGAYFTTQTLALFGGNINFTGVGGGT